MDTFYDDLAPLYHLVYADWEASIERQSRVLDDIIREEMGTQRRLLDVSCGIGTQSLGLARLEYEVTASDISTGAIERARGEAALRGLEIRFSVADMRDAFERFGGDFDVVISAKNSVPHLLSPADILRAFEQFHQCVRPGGLCMISVRDYAAMETAGTRIHPLAVHREGDMRCVVLQLWEFHGEIYDLTMYFVEDRNGAECRTRAMRTQYYAVSIDRLMKLLRQAGFEQVRRIDGRFFQPVIVGRRAEGSPGT